MVKRKGSKLIINLIIVFILYGNLNGMMESWQIRFESSSFWQVPYFSNLFYIYGVFKEVHVQNREFVALGSYSSNDSLFELPNKNMVDLKIHDYFPQSHGEANQRLSFAGIINQPQRVEMEYNRMAEMIKTIYNKSHPTQIKHVFIYLYYWPADPRDYYYRSSEASILILGSN